MIKVLILPADAYRMIDALRDYADILDSEGIDNQRAENAAVRIENGPRSGGLIEVESFDLDAAQGAVIAVMLTRREAAEALRREAEQLEAEAARYEALLERAF